VVSFDFDFVLGSNLMFNSDLSRCYYAIDMNLYFNFDGFFHLCAAILWLSHRRV